MKENKDPEKMNKEEFRNYLVNQARNCEHMVELDFFATNLDYELSLRKQSYGETFYGDREILIGLANRSTLRSYLEDFGRVEKTYQEILEGKDNFKGITTERLKELCEEDLRENSEAILTILGNLNFKDKFSQNKISKLINYSQGKYIN